MSELPSTSGVAAQTSRTDFDDVDLFAEALDRLQDDGNLIADTGLFAEDGPHLTLVRRDETEEATPGEGEPIAREESSPDALDDLNPLLDPDVSGELWLDSAGPSEEPLDANRDASASARGVMPAVSESFELEADGEILLSDDEFLGHDHSAVEDVVLSNPLATPQLIAATVLPDEEPIVDVNMAPAELAPVAACKAPPALGHPGPAPQRIGSGKLATPRYHWKPGDPFGGVENDASRFRWEVMLTTACVTAVCGLGCIWLLRTILV